MARKPKVAEDEIIPQKDIVISKEPVNLGALLSKKPIFQSFRLWICGDTPLIVHAWSEKAKREMLAKQTKAVRGGKEIRDPQQDFVSSLYEMGEIDGKMAYGFPATGFKNAILSSSHKDKGIPRSTVMSALWIDAVMTSARPALAGSICDMPLLRIYGSDPVCREDMTKIGSGLNKIANLAYRGQFTYWAMKITGKFNASVLNADQLVFLIQEAGMASGLGEWRNERRGMFGAFHLASAEEEKHWERFASGKGDIPVQDDMKIAVE